MVNNARSKISKLILAEIQKYPNIPTRTLARMIYAKNKDIFIDVDHVRSSIRYYKGTMGIILRKRVLKNYGKLF